MLTSLVVFVDNFFIPESFFADKAAKVICELGSSCHLG